MGVVTYLLRHAVLAVDYLLCVAGVQLQVCTDAGVARSGGATIKAWPR